MAAKIGRIGQFCLWILGSPYSTPGREPDANKKSKHDSGNLLLIHLRSLLSLSSNFNIILNQSPSSFLNLLVSSKISLVLAI